MLQDRQDTDLSVINACDEALEIETLNRGRTGKAEAQRRRGGCTTEVVFLWSLAASASRAGLERGRNGGIQIYSMRFLQPSPNSRSRMRQHVLAATRRFRHSLLRDAADFRSA